MITDDDVLIDIDEAHGASGVGHAVESGVRAQGFLGKRVMFGATDPCGECDVCRRGGAPVCPSARRRTMPLEKRIVVAARWLVTLDDGLDLPTAIAARVPGDMALAYTLYARSNLAPREPTVLVGRGDVAHYLAQILHAKKIEPTIVAPDDPIDGLRERVLATFAARAIGNRPWRIVCASNDRADLERATLLANARAQLTVVAPAALDAALSLREVTIITVAAPHPDLVVEVAAMCVKRELTLAGAS